MRIIHKFLKKKCVAYVRKLHSKSPNYIGPSWFETFMFKWIYNPIEYKLRVALVKEQDQGIRQMRDY